MKEQTETGMIRFPFVDSVFLREIPLHIDNIRFMFYDQMV